jgi:hypothetical protein
LKEYWIFWSDFPSDAFQFGPITGQIFFRYVTNMQLIESKPVSVAMSATRLEFTTTGGDTWKVWDRFISLDGQQLFHIGNICGTCEFFFRRMSDSPVSSFELEAIRSQLETGIDSVSDPATQFTEIIPNGNYIAALFTAQPKQSGISTADYFTSEQPLAWRAYDNGDSPPNTSYFRGESNPLPDRRKMLFEFFVPLYDLSLLNSDRIQHYVSLLNSGIRPTAVALSVLDVKSSMSFPEDDHGNEIVPEFETHWCFANYLLDGHHKVAASNATGKPITILSFISLDHSANGIDELMEYYRHFR